MFGIKEKGIILTLLLVGMVGFSYLAFADVLTQERPMTLEVGNQAPNITRVHLNDNLSESDDQMDLRPNNRTTLYCNGLVFDLDGFPDIDNASANIWSTGQSSYGDANDKRWHYTNDSCNITEVTSIPNVNANVTCAFNVWYYANFSEWNCTIVVNDTADHVINGSDNATMNKLIAVDVINDTIDWGTIAVDMPYATDLNVSVENEGNVLMDINIDAYNTTAAGTDSNKSFNCSIGSIPTDMIVFNDTPGADYYQSTPLLNTSTLPVDYFDLDPQTGVATDVPTNKSAYFGIYVPGWPTINGTCTGWMRFDASESIN